MCKCVMFNINIDMHSAEFRGIKEQLGVKDDPLCKKLTFDQTDKSYVRPGK